MRLQPEQIDIYKEAPDPEKYAKSVIRARRLIRFCCGLDVTGEDNIPKEGPGIIAFVHRSVIDPWIIGASVPRALSGVGKIELLNWYYFGLGSKYFANRGVNFVNRGEPSVGDLRPNYDALHDKRLVTMSPEATSKNKGAKVGDIKGGVGRLAAWMAFRGELCPVVPMTMTTEHLRPGKAVQVIIGRSILADHNAPSRVVAAEEVDERLYDSLQSLNDQALALSHSK